MSACYGKQSIAFLRSQYIPSVEPFFACVTNTMLRGNTPRTALWHLCSTVKFGVYSYYTLARLHHMAKRSSEHPCQEQHVMTHVVGRSNIAVKSVADTSVGRLA